MSKNINLFIITCFHSLQTPTLGRTYLLIHISLILKFYNLYMDTYVYLFPKSPKIFLRTLRCPKSFV